MGVRILNGMSLIDDEQVQIHGEDVLVDFGVRLQRFSQRSSDDVRKAFLDCSRVDEAKLQRHFLCVVVLSLYRVSSFLLV